MKELLERLKELKRYDISTSGSNGPFSGHLDYEALKDGAWIESDDIDSLIKEFEDKLTKTESTK